MNISGCRPASTQRLGIAISSNPNASAPELDRSMPFVNRVPFVITPETVTSPIPERVKLYGLPQQPAVGGTWAGVRYTAPDCVEQPCIAFNASTLGSDRLYTTWRLRYQADRHDVSSCEIIGNMYHQDQCIAKCIPGYEEANTTFICDSARQV